MDVGRRAKQFAPAEFFIPERVCGSWWKDKKGCTDRQSRSDQNKNRAVRAALALTEWMA